MPDNQTTEIRSKIMSAVRQKNTGPEMEVRRLIHSLGYRYRLHRKSLPGSPDIVFAPRKKVIFVHGCFWHGHSCPKGKLPKTRLDYWEPKIAANLERDKRNINSLEALGWQVCVIWQCEIANLENLEKKITRFLSA